MTRIGVTGHQFLTEDIWAKVTPAVRGFIEDISDGLECVTSLAEGADQVVAQLALDCGGGLHVVLPSEGYETSFANREALARFRSLLARSETVERLGYKKPSEEAYLAAGKRVADLSEVLLAIWDGEPAKGSGGTADIVDHAREAGIEVRVFWPQGAHRT